ncbi:NAD(P)/FAD-dependent oxidoreductase [Kineosporia mesophila]|uniref:NAD(P)/FAD-dependent oxidoreductase n=1 Tax=Kineosporia mesophila TaxID=566012 RepID=A0ABP6Z4C8_9ACTN|nr:NAD(P)/FAD-dependent oxidoreductase [Kineosporia mesophila]MCD5352594.1 NAD(P)/FAD-dependent oxidoreductase [Kineosporia mesophila]
MKVAIVGAGYAGLGTARMLMRCGFEVTVYDRAPDVGGVWSRTRRYPGLRTQNDKRTYAFSELPMPEHYPEWPDGEQVQRYLESYVEHFGLGSSLRLGTEVVTAELTDGPGWSLTLRPAGAGESTQEGFDHLVVANGVFSRPAVPVLTGRTQFEEAGGRVVATSEFHYLEDARGRDVLVVGYGKSACDLAVPISDVASTTTVAARRLLWKMPRKVAGVLNYKYLILTRVGEALFPYFRPSLREKVLPGPGGRVGKAMLAGVKAIAVRQFRLRPLGLVPPGSFGEIARSTVSLVTEGFYERVADGRLRVVRDVRVEELTVRDGRPHARLSSGETLPADLIVCGTGFDQQVPFLAPEVVARLLDERGNFVLHRQILPPDVPALSFAGYRSSFFCPLGAEIGAVWTAAYLLGGLRPPPAARMRAEASEKLCWMEQFSAGKHARGASVVPFSMRDIDEVLADLQLDVGPVVKARQWLLPVDPSSYRGIGTALLTRHGL